MVLLQVHFGWGVRLEVGEPVDDRMLKVRLSNANAMRCISIPANTSKAGYAAEIISILVLGLSKVSTCLFYEALFSQTQRHFARAILVAVVIWMTMSIVLIAVRCTRNPWEDISNAQCSSLVRTRVHELIARLS